MRINQSFTYLLLMNLFLEKFSLIVRTPFMLLILVLFSCNRQDYKALLLVGTSPSDFEDILTIDGTVESVQSYTLTCPDDMDAEVVFLIEDGTMVKEGDVVCILENRELQSEYDQLLIEVENSKAGQNKSKADLNMRYALLDAQVKSINAQTAIANLDSLQLQYSSPNQRRIKELEIQKAAIEKQKLEKKLKALETINRSQIRGLELRLQRWENRAQNAKDMLDKLTLKATQSGMAMRVTSMLTGKMVQEGDQVWSGMPLVSIPDLSKMKVTILASEASYKRINVNDSVEYSFDAMPGNVAWGRILKKAPVGKPVKKDSKVKVFEVEASIDSSLTLPEPGLTANCNVVIQRILDTIVVPQLAIFEVDSMKVVYVKHPKCYEERQVLSGASSPKNAVIVAGLSGNERISLIKPTSSSIKQHTLLPKSIVKKFLPSKNQPKQDPNALIAKPNKIHTK